MGSNNTCVGSAAGQLDANTYNYSTALGYGALFSTSNQIMLGRATESVVCAGTTSSTSTTTGALKVAGGLGVGGAIYGGSMYSGGVVVPNTTVMNTAITTATAGMDTITLRNTALASYPSLTGTNSMTGSNTFSNTTTSTASTNGAVVISGGLGVGGTVNIAGATNITGVCNTLQSADTILPITFSTTPSFSMVSGMVYNLTTSSTAITSLGFTNIPTTPQQTYIFTFVLNPSTANSAWWLKPPTNFLSITAVGGSVNTAVPLVGISNVVLPASYTYLFQQITIVNTSATTTPSFMGFVSVSGY